MKKILVLILAFAVIFGMIGCGGGEVPAEESGYDIAMITDLGTIDDKSFNQGTWEGIVAYAEANDITHKYYKPTEQSTDAYLAAIQLAEGLEWKWNGQHWAVGVLHYLDHVTNG